MCVFRFSLQILYEKFLILRITERDMIKMYIGLHVKYLLFLIQFNETWILAKDFRKKTPQISNFIKIRPLGPPSCSMRTNGRPAGRTDKQTRWS